MISDNLNIDTEVLVPEKMKYQDVSQSVLTKINDRRISHLICDIKQKKQPRLTKIIKFN